jgi:myosin heavy subunit
MLLFCIPPHVTRCSSQITVPDIDPRTPQKVSASVLVRLNPLIQSTAENLIDLVHLNAQSVVEVLRNRFEWDLIYSAVGSMLIAVNPYRDIPYSVSAESARLYFAASPSQLDTMAPHVFAVAARAWFGLQNANFKPQSIIISGESGAGKTENTKFVLKALCQKRSDSLSQDIASKLLALNPITEAFGNACTLRNRNSSRFGKFIDISFDQNGDICGCFMHSYLLEKTRVVTQAAGERNYHIFYQVLSWAEADPSRYQELYLLPRTTYRYLGGQGDKQFADIKDSDDFIEVIDALHECLLSEVDILHLMRIVVLVMNLGNLSFSGRDGKEAADECEVADDAASEACCACMQVSREGLTQAFCTFETQMGLSKVESRIGRVKAGELRDAFSKMIMKLLFDDLVLKMNSAFAGKREDDRKIGVLDIFGFEIFDKNSLEQLCINYTNEKLQQLFCQYTFVHEQEVYTHEGIDWDHIHFEDNRVCIDLFEVVGKDAASFGLFKLLEEQCRFSQPTDEGFFLAFKKNWHPSEKEKKGAVSVTPAKLQRDCFTVAHYASDVSYNIHGLVEKNMDSFAPSMRKLIGNLRNPVLKSIFPLQMYQVEESPDEVSAAHVRKPTASSHSRVDASKTTVTSAFKVQVSGLMAAINKTVPQFVRCIKSNVEKRDGFFDWSVAERQIVTGGIVDAVSIVQQGFPYRRPCKSFAEHYSHLVPSLRKMDHSAALLSKRLTQVSDMAAASNFKRRSVGGDLSLSTTAGPAPSGRLPDVQRCKMILEHLKVSQDKFRVGNTLLFLRAGVIALLEDESARQRHRFATFITKNVTRFLVYRRYKRIRRALLLLQCARRCSVARVALRKRRAVVVRLLQTNIRRFLHRIGYVRMLNQIYHKAKVRPAPRN